MPLIEVYKMKLRAPLIYAPSTVELLDAVNDYLEWLHNELTGLEVKDPLNKFEGIEDIYDTYRGIRKKVVDAGNVMADLNEAFVNHLEGIRWAEKRYMPSKTELIETIIPHLVRKLRVSLRAIKPHSMDKDVTFVTDKHSTIYEYTWAQKFQGRIIPAVEKVQQELIDALNEDKPTRHYLEDGYFEYPERTLEQRLYDADMREADEEMLYQALRSHNTSMD